ncbi:hypothetical protein [Streptomyces sp. NPDC088785]|uniref:hypothetical protein n=1 Tax=Streptomyces sp. NPDC088785 TaxID=3365897 RepID=UPI00382C80D3
MNQHIADEGALRTARRDALAVLLSRAARGVLGPTEAQLLRQHVETEMRDADTARTERDDWAGRCGTADAETDIAQRHAEHAATELRVLRAGLRANGADPTQIQNLWAQIRLRNRQWRDAKVRAAQAEELLSIAHETSNRAETALNRVRGLAAQWARAGQDPTACIDTDAAARALAAAVADPKE